MHEILQLSLDFPRQRRAFAAKIFLARYYNFSTSAAAFLSIFLYKPKSLFIQDIAGA
jgi:hypothetical protein